MASEQAASSDWMLQFLGSMQGHAQTQTSSIPADGTQASPAMTSHPTDLANVVTPQSASAISANATVVAPEASQVTPQASGSSVDYMLQFLGSMQSLSAGSQVVGHGVPADSSAGIGLQQNGMGLQQNGTLPTGYGIPGMPQQCSPATGTLSNPYRENSTPGMLQQSSPATEQQNGSLPNGYGVPGVPQQSSSVTGTAINPYRDDSVVPTTTGTSPPPPGVDGFQPTLMMEAFQPLMSTPQLQTVGLLPSVLGSQPLPAFLPSINQPLGTSSSASVGCTMPQLLDPALAPPAGLQNPYGTTPQLLDPSLAAPVGFQNPYRAQMGLPNLIAQQGMLEPGVHAAQRVPQEGYEQEVPDGTPLEPPKNFADMNPQEQAIAMAAQAAHEAMYAQQYQFMQEMKVAELKRAQKLNKADSGKTECRFVDDYRPLKLCMHMKDRGWCRGAEKCIYAHSYEELHPASPDLPKIDQNSSTSFLAERGGKEHEEVNSQPELKMKKKKDLCERFMRGQCLLGKMCGNAHGAEELGTVGLAVRGFVKIQLCNNWERGKCQYGVNCGRAHGEKEIGLKRPPLELSAPNKRPRDMPVLKADLPTMTAEQKKRYNEYLQELEKMKANFNLDADDD